MLVRDGEQLLEQLLGEIQDVNNDGRDRLKQLNAIINLILKNQLVLKQMVFDSEFTDVEEEITFFKTIKPQLTSLHLFYSRCLFLEMSKPGALKKDLKRYLLNEQRNIKRFFDFNQHFVQYYRSGATSMDALLFVRAVTDPPTWLVTLRFDQDERFATAADHMVSRILAYEKLTILLDQQLQRLSRNLIGQEPTRSMPWTGESINLVEMAYGIYYARQLNHGKAGIGEIIALLEEVFKVKIGKPARRFAEIKRRKRISATKFLDEMRESLLRRIDEDDDLYTSPGSIR